MAYNIHDGDAVNGAIVLTAGAGGVVGVLVGDSSEPVQPALVATPTEQLTDAVEALKRGTELEDRFIRYADPPNDPGIYISDLGSNDVQLINGQFSVHQLFTLDDPTAVLRLPKSPIVRENYRGTQFGERAFFKLDSADVAQTLTPAYDYFVLTTPANPVTDLTFRADPLTPDAVGIGTAPDTAPAAQIIGSLRIVLFLRDIGIGQTVNIFRDGGVPIISFAGPFDSVELEMVWNVFDEWIRGLLSFRGGGVVTYFNDGPI